MSGSFIVPLAAEEITLDIEWDAPAAQDGHTITGYVVYWGTTNPPAAFSEVVGDVLTATVVFEYTFPHFVYIAVEAQGIWDQNYDCVGEDDPDDCCTGENTGTCGTIYETSGYSNVIQYPSSLEIGTPQGNFSLKAQ